MYRLLTVVAGIQEQISHFEEKSAFEIVGGIISRVFLGVGILSAICMIIGGVFMIVGNGNPDTLAKGKKTVIGSVIGLVIALVAVAVTNFVLRAVR